MPAACFLVSGKVQGVFFRASTRERALDLGVNGRATNLPDGRVEVVAEGSAEALDALDAWLHVGPPAARVDTVVRTPWRDGVNEGFVTG
ncbi:acylphosphatase [Pseudoxanthomonas sp. Root630]|uniref:acylphosphatase n=1 Tax=Pseudoxanthomonas sp. Root630 TaxID=1736574 RepID=UPI0007025569|nr:acylphosphatase [Pseudoxanthomonas sp. Root630]KRA46906.1 acylphosphatase [Pseudoxanthomonas sp. Root630]